ncbi:hypothetical protein NUSPORA_01824 [Nucleospora cyclopteri]
MNNKNIEHTIIDALKNTENVTNRELNILPTEIHAVVLSLCAREAVEYEINAVNTRIITEEGQQVIVNGSPEFILINKLQKEENVQINEVDPEALKYAFKNRWVIKTEENALKLIIEEKQLIDLTAEKLQNISEISEKEFAELKRRKFCTVKKENIYRIKKGNKFFINSKENCELTTDIMQLHLTHCINTEFLNSFKAYNFNSTGILPHCGSLNPLMKMRSEFKKIFIEMGFCEMETNQYLESSFWNFDSLFQPQNHPSREAHDTFFLAHPERDTLQEESKEYIERVKKIHTEGNEDSLGHSYEWDIKEAEKLILRTHTTAISSRRLYENISDPSRRKKELKLFSIDKVFRNETVDATHLAEFHQVEGLVLGENLSLGDLMGILSMFFSKLGLNKIKFKPAFNPYTEPSMEIFGYHEGLRKWIEIGNSGIFRPEMLQPMGYDKNATVIAWGLSLERPAMIKYGLNNIRELVGHKVDLNFIRESEIIDF